MAATVTSLYLSQLPRISNIYCHSALKANASTPIVAVSGIFTNSNAVNLIKSCYSFHVILNLSVITGKEYIWAMQTCLMTRWESYRVFGC